MDLIEYFLKKYKIIQKKYTHDNNNHINQYVDTIYVINLASNPVRRHYIKLMMEKMKINYTIIVVQKIHKNVYRYLLNLQHTQNDAISQGEMGTYLSHMWCLRDAINNNYKKFIILEDDILFHKQFHVLFKQIVSEKEYDFLMLGASHFNRGANYYKPKNQVYMPSFDVLGGNLLGAFAILYTNKSATFVYE
jgi:GR25 family glycosyltransferase involved in LPS biosynthesis